MKKYILLLAAALALFAPAAHAASLVNPSQITSSTLPNPLQGNFRDTASSTAIIPTYTYSVCPTVGECDFTTIQAAIAAASSSQAAAAIYIHGGTYTAPTSTPAYSLCSSHLTIYGDGDATRINWNPTTAGAMFASCNTSTALSNIIVDNIFVSYAATRVTSSTFVDFDGIGTSFFMFNHSQNFGTDYYASGTLATYHNVFAFNTMSKTSFSSGIANTCINLGNLENQNTLISNRCLPVASTTAWNINGHTSLLIGNDSEASGTCMNFGPNSYNSTMEGNYCEADTYGIVMASGTYGLTFTGGYLTNPGVANIVNNGAKQISFNNVAVSVNGVYNSITISDSQANYPQYEWQTPYFTAAGSCTTNATSTAVTTVYLQEFNEPTAWIPSSLHINYGASVNSNEVAYAVYGPNINLDTAASTSRVAYATTTGNGVSTNSDWALSFPSSTPQNLQPAGSFYTAVMQLSTSTTYFRCGNTSIVNGYSQSFTDPSSSDQLPANLNNVTPSNTNTNFPGTRVQNSSIGTF
jgi:hypothetical protein